MGAFKSGFVPIVGRPNVGKSTLINRLVGQKVAITSPKPQTTWGRVLGIRTTSKGQMVFVDTPGIHRPKGNFNRHMVQKAKEAIREGDVVLHVTDVTHPFDPEEEDIWTFLRERGCPAVLAVNKVDLAKSPAQVEEIAEAFRKKYPYQRIVPTSALLGDGVEELEEAILSLLPEGPMLFPEDMATDQSERLLAQEIIREKIFHYTHQEIPYCCAVTVEEFREEPEKGLLYIQATINVERESQKGIVIGKGGRMLKQIGTAARRELEEIFGKRVYLDLWVRVQEDWREKDFVLRDLGLLR